MILWTDGERLWEPVIGLLAEALPEISMLKDEKEAGKYWGPSTWVRHAISRYEGERIEYKAGWNPDPILRTLWLLPTTSPIQGADTLSLVRTATMQASQFPPAGYP